MQLIENIPKTLWQSKLLCFPCDLSNIQKCSFKECPFTWVGLLSMILFNPKLSYSYQGEKENQCINISKLFKTIQVGTYLGRLESKCLSFKVHIEGNISMKMVFACIKPIW